MPILEPSIRRIAERVAMGLPVEQACAIEDPPVSVEQWAALESHPRGRGFVLRAIGQFHEMLIRNELLQGKRSLELLERRFPELWSKPDPQTRVDVTVNMDLSELSDADLNRIAQGELLPSPGRN